MSFFCKVMARDFKRAFNAVMPSAASRSVVPVLEMARLEMRDVELVIEATDLDHLSSAAVPAEGRKGTVLVPARRMAAVIGALPGGETVVLRSEVNPPMLVIETAAGQVTLAAPCPAADWPPEGSGHTDERHGILDGRFAAALRRIRPFISTEETRYYLNGVFVHELDGELAAVATDGHRLARLSGLGPLQRPGANEPDLLDGCEQSTDMRGFIFPRVAVAAYVRLFADVEEVAATLHLIPHSRDGSRTGRQPVRVVFSAGNRRLQARLIDGTYPDYRRVIPEPPAPFITCERRALLRALDFAVRVLPRGETPPILLSIQHDGAARRLALDIQSMDGDGALLPVPLIDGSAEVEPFNLNPRYLRDLAVFCDWDELTLRAATHGDPVRADGPDGALCIQMPMRGFRDPRPLLRRAAV